MDWGPVLAGIFMVSVLLVLLGWARLLRLALRLEGDRHGWGAAGRLRQLLALRREAVSQGGKRLPRYLREDVRALAEAHGQADDHRRAVDTLHLGYAGAVTSGLAHMLLTAMTEGVV